VLEARDRGINVPQYAIDKTKMVMEIHRDSISRAIDAGVNVAMGTDSGVTPHGQNLRELEEMVGCGMTPAQALIATTLTAAELLGVEEDRGVIETGKRADIVIADGQVGDVTDLRARIRTVVQDGLVMVTRP
jgi:imidazolonepropionase-like amidohydrolase